MNKQTILTIIGSVVLSLVVGFYIGSWWSNQLRQPIKMVTDSSNVVYLVSESQLMEVGTKSTIKIGQQIGSYK